MNLIYKFLKLLHRIILKMYIFICALYNGLNTSCNMNEELKLIVGDPFEQSAPSLNTHLVLPNTGTAESQAILYIIISLPCIIARH